ncbi:MAG: hypothetical protein V3V19_11085 [Cocleimonas sp.]
MSNSTILSKFRSKAKSKMYKIIKENPGISAMPSAIGKKAGLNLNKSTYWGHIQYLKAKDFIIEINGRYFVNGDV